MFFSLTEHRNYIAIIGDIKNSKEIKDRGDIQVKLQQVLNEINLCFAECIRSKFTITLGDEFQGLLVSGANIMKILLKIKQKMYPIRLRFGIGVGKITTEIHSQIAIGADGPAYYKAREAVDYLKLNEKRNSAAEQDIFIEADCGNEKQVRMINTVFMLLYNLETEWTQRQREVVLDMLEFQDNQKDAAARLGVSQPNIQKNLARGKYYVYSRAVENLEEVLEEIVYDEC